MGSVKIGCTLLAWGACYFCVFLEEIAFGVSTTPELCHYVFFFVVEVVRCFGGSSMYSVHVPSPLL